LQANLTGLTTQSTKQLKLILADLIVPTGALVCSLWINKVMQAGAPVHFFTLLWCSVWLIYVVDRLFDAHKLRLKAVSDRHLFYHQNRKLFITLCMLLVAVLLPYAWWLWQQPDMLRLLRFGNSMVWICVVYFLYLQYFPGHLKELFVALIFWCGTVLFHLPPLSAISAHQAMIALGLGVLYFANLLLFALIEEQNDRQQHHGSLVLWLGRKRVQILFWSALSVCLIISAMLITFVRYIDAFIMAAMAIWLVATALQQRLPVLNRRLAADCIFLMPVAALFTT
jgi:hypothetical protein